jgi:5S rRNA maturation endonuclease (ribonuclease M5)
MNSLMKQSTSYSQTQLKNLCDLACDDIEKLLEVLGVEDYRMTDKMVLCRCPIHEGDNHSALNLYYTGDMYRGNWKCRTHNCEEVFKSSIIGFVRGVLSRQQYEWSESGDKTVSFKQAVEFILKFLNKDLDSINTTKSSSVDNFVYISKNFSKNTQSEQMKLDPQQVKRSLHIPAQYYLDRGYSREVLEKYSVGLCDNPKKPFYNRVVVPVYSTDGMYVTGCTGRSIHSQCSSCKSYHHPNKQCPEPNKRWIYSKWKHNQNFQSQNNLYNFSFAKPHIKDTKTIILVESPGNVWRLEEAGLHNSVGLFGSSLSNYQKLLIDSSGAMNIVVLTDNDEAGHKAYQQIQEKCKDIYRIYRPEFDAPDIGEMKITDIQNIILPQLEKIYEQY